MKPFFTLIPKYLASCAVTFLCINYVFAQPPANDNPCPGGAIVLTVNGGTSCSTTTNGTLNSHPLKTCFSSDKGINDLPGQ
jgi:hypothetical protein